MQTSKDSLNKSLKKEIIDTFFQTIDDLKNKREIEIFFNSFLNDAELEKYSKRLAIAYWLKKNRSTENIKNNLKVSTKEISNTKDQLHEPGFKLALKKMEAEEWANKWNEKITKLGKVG